MSAAPSWEASGLAALTGAPGQPAHPVRDHVRALERLLREVEAAARGLGGDLALDLGLFTERAAELGLQGQGRTSCNGSARMLRTADGWAAVNLARPDDADLIPAWIGRMGAAGPWDDLADHARTSKAEDFVARGRLLGVPVAVVRRPGEIRGRAVPSRASPGRRRPDRPLRVVDLSALWAGPLCGRLLADLGAEVIKVESPRRPDAARQGTPRLFERLHRGQTFRALDFTAPDGRADLLALIEDADVVIEASRPRALAQIGVYAAEILARRPGLTWISLTAYGRAGDQGQWIGFGDDVAAAAGLVAFDAADAPVFLGDAIADPIAGLTMARDGLRAILAGGGMVEVSMQAAAAAIADTDPLPSAEAAA